MKYLSFILSTLLSLPAIAIASTCETNYPIVDECYETRGRMQAANGNPSVRIWKVGTKRILGVKNENLENLPAKIKEVFSFGVFVFADYRVCPLTKGKPGRMQMVCVDSMKNIRIEDYRENPDVPEVTIIQNETEQASAMGPLLVIIVICAVVMVFLSLSRSKNKIRKFTKPLEHKSGYQKHRKSYPQKKSIQSEQQNNVKTANKTKAQSEAAVKEQIKNFPEVKVEHIIDGDTVIVVKDWHKIRIRLDSIDCPENGQHWGDTAKYGLIKLIGGRKIRLEEHGQDFYERTLATIYLQHGYGSEWLNVNERMVTLGHAWVMRRFYDHLPKDRQDKLNRLERWARPKKVGLWQTPSPIPPWKWRSEG
jgi:micrococcal nuclease